MINIQNIYYMLAYAFDVLHKEDYASLGQEDFDNVLDMYTAILSIGVNQLIKRGLGKEYIEETDDTSSIAGKILLSESIKKNTLTNKRVVCVRDEFSKNTYINKILKTTCYHLIKSKFVNKKYKKTLKREIMFFADVDSLDIRHINWNSLSYHRNNRIYQMLISICYLVVHGLLLNKDLGKTNVTNFMDNQKLYKLYERFVLKYYQRHFPEYAPKSCFIDWNIDDENNNLLPKMKTDITLSKNNKVLIIDTKMYNKMMQEYYNSKSQHSGNMYQIYSYVKNYDKQKTGDVLGMLLYARTDEDYIPDNEYNIDGNKIFVSSLDLNKDFSAISLKLNEIVNLIL